ncbi:MAG TPA: sulfite exporter TauE/SafE family protein [Opitutaceae bacterium]|nr:sulfite exporter TauE/SafE family protein [Opitutaceae bacterium]
MPPAAYLSPGAAFAAGLIASLHCAGMCGPLACAVLPPPRPGEDASAVASAYQLARIGGYALLGAAAGGLGRLPLSWLPLGVLRFAPWLAVLFFLGLALGWDRRWAKPLAPARAIFRLSRRLGRRSAAAAAAAVGLATPLLPCGPLYFFFGLALLAGSAARGAELMLAFGLGTLPLLWIAQAQLWRIQGRLSPRWLGRLRIGLALLAAAASAWRARAAFLGGGETCPWLCF